MNYKEKYDAVKAELERRMYDDYNDGEDEEDAVAQGICASMIMFMDSLPDESSDNDLEDEIYKIQKYYKTIDEYDNYLATIYKGNIEHIAKHFANWQREHDLKENLPTEISEIVKRIAHDCGHTFESSFAILAAAQKAYQRGLKDKDKVINVKED